jgi:Xaa-Pro aminopeptidase
MRRFRIAILTIVWASLAVPFAAQAQDARGRWDRRAQIRRDKFDLVLPEVMRENQIDMWITVVKEGLPDPLVDDLGNGYVIPIGYYVFTDRGGDRIERVALNISGYLLEQSGAYDLVTSDFDLLSFVSERNPQRIGLNMSDQIGAADGLSHTSYRHLVETLGETYASRFVSAEKLISDFRSRRVASEIAAFGEAGEISREIAERALSNEVITVGITTLEDVAWWMMDELLARGLDTSFDFPSVYVTGPDGIVATSSDRIIRGGDFMMIDWGVGFLNFHTDMKRVAYVLREGEMEAPESFQRAFRRGVEAREVIRKTIRAGLTAQENNDAIERALGAAGFPVIEFNQPNGGETTDVFFGNHSVGNLGHGVGPSIAFWNPLRITYEVKPSTMLSIELFAYSPIEEWGGAKARVPLEDDAIVTERGVEWLYPANTRLRIIR